MSERMDGWMNRWMATTEFIELMVKTPRDACSCVMSTNGEEAGVL